MEGKPVEHFDLDNFIFLYELLKKRSKHLKNETDDIFFDGYFQCLADMRKLITDCMH